MRLLGLTICPMTANGACTIDLNTVESSTARASLQEVSSAARYVINQCVNARPSTGGIVRDIGEKVISANLTLYLVTDNPPQAATITSPSPFINTTPKYNAPATYPPPCYHHARASSTPCPQAKTSRPGGQQTTFSPSSSSPCLIFPVSTSKLFHFRPQGKKAHHKNQKLNEGSYTADRLCKLTISSDGFTDTAARYQFWSAAVALTGVCVRRGQIGRRIQLGECSLSLSLSLSLSAVGTESTQKKPPARQGHNKT